MALGLQRPQLDGRHLHVGIHEPSDAPCRGVDPLPVVLVVQVKRRLHRPHVGHLGGQLLDFPVDVGDEVAVEALLVRPETDDVVLDRLEDVGWIDGAGFRIARNGVDTGMLYRLLCRQVGAALRFRHLGD